MQKPDKCQWCQAECQAEARSPHHPYAKDVMFACGTTWNCSAVGREAWTQSPRCREVTTFRTAQCRWCGTTNFYRNRQGIIIFSCGTVASPPPDHKGYWDQEIYRWLIGPDCDPTGKSKNVYNIEKAIQDIHGRCRWCGCGVDHTIKSAGGRTVYYSCDTVQVLSQGHPAEWSQGHWCRIQKEKGVNARLKKADIDNRFTYHPPFGNQAQRYENLREQVRRLAHTFVAVCPESRELATALTHLDIAMMMANAAIARNEKPPKENG
jgi:hypothetical protein